MMKGKARVDAPIFALNSVFIFIFMGSSLMRYNNIDRVKII